MSDVDPFEQPDKAKSISWKGAPIGATITGTVEGPAAKVQAKDFETGEPAKWPDGNPKYSAVVNFTVDGELRSLWAIIPSALFKALADAQSAAGKKFDKGGKLTVRYTGDKPNEKNPRLAPAKQFAAKYEPPTESDPWATDDEPPF